VWYEPRCGRRRQVASKGCNSDCTPTRHARACRCAAWAPPPPGPSQHSRYPRKRSSGLTEVSGSLLGPKRARRDAASDDDRPAGVACDLQGGSHAGVGERSLTTARRRAACVAERCGLCVRQDSVCTLLMATHPAPCTRRRGAPLLRTAPPHVEQAQCLLDGHLAKVNLLLPTASDSTICSSAICTISSSPLHPVRRLHVNTCSAHETHTQSGVVCSDLLWRWQQATGIMVPSLLLLMVALLWPAGAAAVQHTSRQQLPLLRPRVSAAEKRRQTAASGCSGEAVPAHRSHPCADHPTKAWAF
jgi:hypothetical protein